MYKRQDPVRAGSKIRSTSKIKIGIEMIRIKIRTKGTSMRPLLVFASILIAASCSWADTKPNIVYIMVDDMGPADAGFMGSTAIKTPHLDELAKASLYFTEAYSGCTVCAPCRSVLMTGKPMGRTSV